MSFTRECSSLCVIWCLAMLCGVVGASAEPDLTGYKLLLEDEFNGDSLDLSKWQVGTTPSGGQWGSDSYFVTAESEDAELFRQVYIVKDGVLTIRANYSAEFADPSHGQRKWYSGMIATAFSNGRSPSAAFRKGYVEIRQKFPRGKGVWAANWACNLLSQTPEGDPLGTIEIDGLETYGVEPKGFLTTVHHWKKPEVHAESAARNLPDLTADFHVYGYLIDDAEIDVFLDGRLLNKTQLFRKDNVDKFFWMFNLAMGGGWPIDVPPSQHYDMQIDYVRIYSKDADARAFNSP